MRKIFLLFAFIAVFSCNSGKPDETPTRGSITVLTDETFFPMIEDQVTVFESRYQYAKINVVTYPEYKIAEMLLEDSSRIAVLSRDLTASEEEYFKQKSLIPVSTDICYDAIALIVNKNVKDTLISQSQITNIMSGKEDKNNPILVFDSPGSSTLDYMRKLLGNDTISTKNVFSLNSNEEVIKYISENEGSIGFVGVNWLYQPVKEQQQYVDKIKVLSIATNEGHYKPTQDNVAGGLYPFTRTVKVINCQGKAGLGVGFATFAATDVGQRIVLKAGLVPVTYPKREIVINNK